MVFEYEIRPLLDWLFRNPDNYRSLGAIPIFLIAVFALFILGSFFGYVAAAVRFGPFEAFYVVAKIVVNAFPDFVWMSPRRVGALSWLSIKEALRNRVLVAFAVFAVILLFGSWYLDSKSDHPATLYLSVVLTTTNYLMLLLGLFLSALSLPTDVKNRTIYTIVTKPVRAGEIVLGRIIGFGAIGTFLLAIMYVVSFVFVYFGLRHSHEISEQDLVEVSAVAPKRPGDKRPGEQKSARVPDDGAAKRKQGQSSVTRYHQHTVTIDSSGRMSTDSQQDHRHPVRKVGEGTDAKYVLDPPQNQLPARVPLLGKLEFQDRTGSVRSKKGINVGNEWLYRSYIEGGTAAAAIWTFEGVTPEKFPNGLPLELTIRVFRSHKGRIEQRVTGSIVIKNPDPKKDLQSAPLIFETAEYSVQELTVPRNQPLVGADGKTRDKIKQDGKERDADLFADLVENGKVEVWLSCADPAQYFGMAQSDVYLRRADGSFAVNLLKGYYSIWLQMLLVICFGVMSSTFLSGAVALVTTVSTLLIGLFNKFIMEIFSSLIGPDEGSMGGGTIESLIRIITQKGVIDDLDLPQLAMRIIRWLDVGMFSFIWLGANVLPNFARFDTSMLVATGYDVPGGLLLQHTLAVAGYVIVMSTLGYFFFRTREIAA